jgi:MFS family permease
MADPAARSPDRLLQGREAVGLFAVFGFTYFFAALLRAVTATLAPTLAEDLDVGPGALGLLTGALFIGYAITQLPLGHWLDRFGPRLVLAGSLAIAVIGCVAFALAGGFAGLAFARVLMGIGLSACLMAPLTAFRRWYGPAAQLRANSWILMSGAFGMVASTVPVQMLVPVMGWRGVFVAVAVVFVLAIAAVLAQVPRESVRGPGASSPGASGGYREIWRQRTFRSYAGLAFVNYAGLMAMQTLWIGPWLVNVAGHTRGGAAAGLFLVNACMLAAFFAWGFAMPRLTQAGWTAGRLIAWGTPLSVVVLASIVVLGPQAGAGMWALYCLSCTFMSLAQPLVGRSFPDALVGRALSAYNLLFLSGVFVLQWTIGLGIDLLRSMGADTAQAYRGAFALYALVALAACLLHLRDYRRAPGDEAGDLSRAGSAHGPSPPPAVRTSSRTDSA